MAGYQIATRRLVHSYLKWLEKYCSPTLLMKIPNRLKQSPTLLMKIEKKPRLTSKEGKASWRSQFISKSIASDLRTSSHKFQTELFVFYDYCLAKCAPVYIDSNCIAHFGNLSDHKLCTSLVLEQCLSNHPSNENEAFLVKILMG